MTVIGDIYRELPAGPVKDAIREEALLPMLNEFDIIALPVLQAVLVVAAAIALNAILGMILAAKEGEFDIRRMPEFLATHVLPYLGGLLLVGWVAHLLPEPYSAVFYPVAAAALAKYLADIKDKLAGLFGYDNK